MNKTVFFAALLSASAALCETYNLPRFAAESDEYDVVVVGGTSAAVGAAAAARDAGARTLVIAPGAALADDLTGHLRLEFPKATWQRSPVNDGIFNIMGAAVASYGDVTPLQLKRMADEVLMFRGIPFLLFHRVTDVLFDADGNVAAVKVCGRSEDFVVKTRAVIDGTERAALARKAGCTFTAFNGGTIEFERRVIAGEAPAAKGLTVRELPSRNTVVPLQGVPQEPAHGSVTGCFYSCSFSLDVKDLSARTLADVEQRARDMTWVTSTLDASDSVRFFPPDRLVSAVPGVYVAGVVGEADEQAARKRYDSVFVDAPAAGEIGKRAAEFARVASDRGKAQPAAGGEEPVVTCDVFVAGMGTCGAPAVIAAAEEGMKVIGCDVLHRMGGLMTEALIGSYCFGYRKGFTHEIDKGVHGFGAVYSVAKAEWFRQRARGLGAELWFGAAVSGVEVRDGKLCAAKVVMADGTRVTVRAKVFIDATGNADLAAAAGEETEFIRDDELSLQGAGSTQKLLGASYRNTDYAFVDDTDARDLAFFTLRARYSMALWAWDQAQMVSSRERRRLKGVFSVSVQDALLGRTYPDIVSVTESNFDTHGQTFDDQFFIEDVGHKVIRVNLPYRCLLPKRTDGLLVAGLGMSAHRDAMPILRMQPDVQNQGFVVGLAAGLSVREGVAVRDVDMSVLQKRLVARDILPRELAGVRDNFPLPDKDFDKAVESLPNGYAGLAVLLSDPVRAVPRLREAYGRDPRLEYAHLLAMLGDGTGAQALVDRLEESTEWDKGWNYKGMDQFGRSVSWIDSYLIALGRTRADGAFAAIARKASALRGDHAYSHFRAVARSLESLGDKRGAAILKALLALPGVRGHAMAPGSVLEPVPGYGRYSRHNMGLGDVERSNCLRELCLARALLNLGDTPDGLGKAILGEYAADPRKAYANHAKRVLR